VRVFARATARLEMVRSVGAATPTITPRHRTEDLEDVLPPQTSSIFHKDNRLGCGQQRAI